MDTKTLRAARLTIDDLDPDFVEESRARCAAGQTCDNCDEPAEFDTTEYLSCEGCLVEAAESGAAAEFDASDRAQRRAESGYAQ